MYRGAAALARNVPEDVQKRFQMSSIESSVDDAPALTLSLAQVDELHRLNRRILNRSVLVTCMLEDERFECDREAVEGGDVPTMAEILTEQLDDVGEAARAIATLMRQAKTRGA